jgi:hypothetical protein
MRLTQPITRRAATPQRQMNISLRCGIPLVIAADHRYLPAPIGAFCYPDDPDVPGAPSRRTDSMEGSEP